MSQPEPATNAPPSDPRLLLPEWLRDEPATGEEERSAAAVDVPHGSRRPVVNASVATVGPGLLVQTGSTWQAPPPPVESFDPSKLISPEDLPSWIRSVPDDRGDVDDRVPHHAIGMAVAAATTIDEEDLTDQHAGEGEENLTPPAPHVSDLTETRFVLLAGGTLVAILAVIALFYL